VPKYNNEIKIKSTVKLFFLFLVRNEYYYVPAGSKVTFNCTLSGASAPTWNKLGPGIETTGSTTQDGKYHASLTIGHVTVAHSGDYECLTTNNDTGIEIKDIYKKFVLDVVASK